MDAEELLIFLMNHPWCMFWCGLLMLACSPAAAATAAALLYLPVAAAALLYLPVAAAALLYLPVAATALLYLPVAAAALYLPVAAAADTLHCPADMPDLFPRVYGVCALTSRLLLKIFPNNQDIL